MYSILLSLYHKEREEYLAACLDSLIVQTCPVSEVIIVFDGAIKNH
ncbi:glycosyl transferase, family 2 protein-2 [Rodentibacter pneumotropicus]|uniref:Glycosyl transferase, family 2 protein-2 n=1 Tax=Rodentibacter pneumotropicus TaxID=758 RepID=A0A448MLI5_9PAST|nr:glycosyl transferase, family 2 protein-2 [Rodentibacter pneumotropicus]